MVETYVLDASVATKWFNKLEPHADLAEALREKYTNGAMDFVVPELLFLEVANALRYNEKFVEADIHEAIESLREMQFMVFHINDLVGKKFIINEAVSAAYDYGLSLYDAVYVALSKLLGFPILTEDEKTLYQKIVNKVSVFRLVDLKL